MYWIYVLKSQKDKKRYIGYTSNLEKRIEKHKKGQVSSTKFRRPLELIYSETFTVKEDALRREKFLKSGKGREYLDSQNI